MSKIVKSTEYFKCDICGLEMVVVSDDRLPKDWIQLTIKRQDNEPSKSQHICDGCIVRIKPLINKPEGTDDA